jgi:glycosyltransferase involved in cell wall biosynthesis
LEALSVGLPPLLSDSPNASVHRYAMDKDNLFHWNKPKDLAKKLDWWYEHPAERAACAAKYKGYAKQFDFDVSMDKMEKMYLKTIEEFGKHEG